MTILKSFFSRVPKINQHKNSVPRSKDVLCSPRRDGHTDRQTHTKVTTEGTLSGFQDFFLQPIIKDRPNNRILTILLSGQSRSQRQVGLGQWSFEYGRKTTTLFPGLSMGDITLIGMFSIVLEHVNYRPVLFTSWERFAAARRCACFKVFFVS